MRFIPDEYTVESVTVGHPDKVCDQMSDAILDAYLAEDKQARVAVEVMGSHGTLIIGGEVTSSAAVDVAEVALAVYREIGYQDELDVITRVSQQSSEIAHGVDGGGAGDQGIMYGFATTDSEQMMPLGVDLAHQLTKALARSRQEGAEWMRSDGKAQVTMRNGKPHTVLISVQHDPKVSLEQIGVGIGEEVLASIEAITDATNIIINPAGEWTLGGFAADTGMTGRKIMVDSYGGLIPHGGGAFSGKDPTKVDRSAAYMARFVAKQLVQRGLGEEVLVSVAYAIGKAEPLMLRAENERGQDLSEELREFDFRPQAIIEKLDLRQPIYQETAKHGHFGNGLFPWEQLQGVSV